MIRQLLIAALVLGLWLPTAACQQRTLQQGIDALHYDFTLRLPDSGHSIRGAASIDIERSVPNDKVILDLVDLRVDSVFVNGRRVVFDRDRTTLTIPLSPPTCALPDTVKIDVHYGGDVVDGLIIEKDSRGRWSAFADNWPTRARHWIPAIDDPGDKATVEWHVIAPAGRRVVANGTLISEKPLHSGLSGNVVTSWKTARPIPTYLMVIAAGPLVVENLGVTSRGLSEFPPGVPQSIYVQPELSSYVPGPFERAGDIVDFFAETVGPFPYEKLAHVQSRTRYGGMENASAIFYADALFQHRMITYGLIAHETAHQWFGDAVTPRSWPHVWLSEGFATYFEKLWVEKSNGEAAFRTGMRQLRDEIVRANEVADRPVIDSLQTNLMSLLNTNSYQKGGWTLHMLRRLLGDSLLFGGIRAYYAQYRHATATTDDLCQSLERYSRIDLRWFFDQWLRRPGFPEVTIGWKVEPSGSRLTVEVEQSFRFDYYRMPLTIEFRQKNGASQLVNIEVPAEKLFRISIPIVRGFSPDSIVPDPGVNVLATFKARTLE